MRSTSTYLAALLFVFGLSTVITSAQTRVQKLYTRSSIDGVKKSDPTKKIIIQVYNKKHHPLVDSYLKIDKTELEFEANENGQIQVELPAILKDQDLILKIYGKGHYSKTLLISFDNFDEVYKEVNIKSHLFHPGGCPSF